MLAQPILTFMLRLGLLITQVGGFRCTQYFHWERPWADRPLLSSAAPACLQESVFLAIHLKRSQKSTFHSILTFLENSTHCRLGSHGLFLKQIPTPKLGCDCFCFRPLRQTSVCANILHSPNSVKARPFLPLWHSFVGKKRNCSLLPTSPIYCLFDDLHTHILTVFDCSLVVQADVL